MKEGYVVRVQLVRYEYAPNGDCSGESIVESAESRVFAKATAHHLYLRAEEAAEAEP